MEQASGDQRRASGFRKRLYAERHGSPYQLLYSYPAPSDAYFGLSLSRQIDWTIENFLADVVAWITAWLGIVDSTRYRILLTTFSDIVADERRYIGKILEFYGIPHERFRPPDIARTVAGSHFRVGREDEWLEVFSPAQIERTTAMIGDELLTRFGWPEAGRPQRFDHRFCSAAD